MMQSRRGKQIDEAASGVTQHSFTALSNNNKKCNTVNV